MPPLTHFPRLTVTPPSASASPDPLHGYESPRTGVPLPRISVLIAEDDPDLREIFEIAFKHRHFEVQTVRNGQEAINLLEEGLPQVLVLDINMPQVSGLEVLRHIREQGLHDEMHVIVLTANPGYKYDPEIEFVSLFLEKPVSIDHLTHFATRLVA
jgi:DNA-binding response OmpR family regulator